MRRLLQLLGLYDGEDYEEDSEEYSEYEEEQSREQPRGPKKNRMGKKDEGLKSRSAAPRLVFFQGVPSENSKLRLRDILLDGAIVLLDLQGLDAGRIEEGRNFINFMGGVAFAHKGLMERIGPSLFVITPREGMLEWWEEEE
ncbi:MAG: cell division protein SepF [Synergistaceae bacterium]|nr:cell division protein SepF [Synergistaceae bacterium]